jgi:hypothetical protein
MKKTPSVSRLIWLCFPTLLCLFPPGHICRAATLIWTNTSSGNWNTAANWNPNTVPGPGDSAVITNPGSYTVTLDVNATLDRLTLGGASGTQTLFASSRSLVLSGASAINNNGINVLVSSTLAGTGTLTNQATLNADNSTINTALINQGLLVFRGNASLGGLVDNQAGATLRVQADGSFAGTATLTVTNGFTNNGKIELTSAVDAEQVTLNVNSGSLVNGPGG